MRACRLAIPTVEALCWFPVRSGFGIRTALAIHNTHPAPVAGILIALDLDQRIFAGNPKQRTQRAYITAPETRPIQIEQNHRAENNRD
jgi:hypothetical protein